MHGQTVAALWLLLMFCIHILCMRNFVRAGRFTLIVTAYILKKELVQRSNKRNNQKALFIYSIYQCKEIWRSSSTDFRTVRSFTVRQKLHFHGKSFILYVLSYKFSHRSHSYPRYHLHGFTAFTKTRLKPICDVNILTRLVLLKAFKHHACIM